jgi:hypothetical protein
MRAALALQGNQKMFSSSNRRVEESSRVDGTKTSFFLQY